MEKINYKDLKKNKMEDTNDGDNNSSNSRSDESVAKSLSPAPTGIVPQRKSLVGNKFARKTNSTSAFGGSGKKLG